MTTPSIDPPPLDLAEHGVNGRTERQLLEAFLDYQRQAVPNKVVGVREDDARRRMVQSSTTLIGLLKHLAAVERGWYQRVLAGRSEEEIGAHARGDDPNWIVGDDESIADAVAEYDRACAES